MKNSFILILLATLFLGCNTTSTKLHRTVNGPDTTKPLGARENPIRCSMPYGEREYLMRLRCPSGEEPLFERNGSVGVGPYGNILDAYGLNCVESDLKTTVYMDMYHREYREMSPIPDFSIHSYIPALIAEGCPPQVPEYEEEVYIFRAMEVRKPAHFQMKERPVVEIGKKGRVYVSFVLSAQGVIEEDSINIEYISDESLKIPALDYLKALSLVPAEHHSGCFVPQKFKMGINFK